MPSDDPNRAALVRVAEALGTLRERVLFVGGATVGLLLSDPAAPRPRPTYDVDLVVELDGLAALQGELREALRARGFRESLAAEDPICAWRLGDLRVDLLPTRAEILGFTNRWYGSARVHADRVDLGGLEILRIDAPHFLATKLEAFAGRGGDDVYASHDLEDVVVLVDGRPELVTELAMAPSELRAFVAETLKGLLERRDFRDALSGHVQDAGRDRIVRDRLLLLSHP